MENGIIIISMGGVFIYGWRVKDKENTLEIAMKVTGLMELGRGLEFSIMLMDQNMRDIGKIT